MNMQTTVVSRTLVLGLLGCGLLAGCAKNGTGTSSGPLGTPTAGTVATGVAGKGGAGGSAAGSTAVAAGGTTAAPMPVPCGPKICELSTINVPGLMTGAPCCVDATQGTC